MINSQQALEQAIKEIEGEKREVLLKTKELDKLEIAIRQKKEELNHLESEAANITSHLNSLKARMASNEQAMTRAQVEIKKMLEEKKR